MSLKLGINKVTAYIAVNKESGQQFVDTIALSRGACWDRVYYGKERANSLFKREMAEKNLSSRWEVFEVQIISPYTAPFATEN